MITYLRGIGHVNHEWAILLLTNPERTRLGFRLSRVAATAIHDVTVYGEYEDPDVPHPRPRPYADRWILDFEPGEEFTHWFPFPPPYEGNIYVAVEVGGQTVFADYERVDIAVFEQCHLDDADSASPK